MRVNDESLEHAFRIEDRAVASGVPFPLQTINYTDEKNCTRVATIRNRQWCNAMAPAGIWAHMAVLRYLQNESCRDEEPGDIYTDITIGQLVQRTGLSRRRLRMALAWLSEQRMIRRLPGTARIVFGTWRRSKYRPDERLEVFLSDIVLDVYSEENVNAVGLGNL